MRKRNSYHLENISSRKNKWNIEYNDYTSHLTLSNTLSVYQSGHKNTVRRISNAVPTYMTTTLSTISLPAAVLLLIRPALIRSGQATRF